MSIVLVGSTSGSVTLQEPAIAGTTVLDLPAVSGTILTTGSSGQSIPKAALPTGSVLQVVQGTYSTETAISSTSYTDSGLSASITPTSATSKILVIASMAADTYRQSNVPVGVYQNIVRGSTQITEKLGFIGSAVSSDTYYYNLHNTTFIYLDSPATTSSTTYKIQGKLSATSNSANLRYNTNSSTSSIVLMEIAA